MFSPSQESYFLAVLGMLLLLLKSGVTQEDSVSQSLSEVSITEGQDALLHCDFNTTLSSPYLFWYHQFPNHSPGHILTKHKYLPLEPAGKYSGTLNSEGNSVTLKIWKVSPADEAVYYCALSLYGADKLSFGSGTRLTVHPNLEPSLPSVYKLKPSSEEKQGKAACLFTDYSPNPLNVGINKEVTKEVNGSVVVVKEDKSEKGTASYGIVLWGDDTDSFHCHADAENPKGDSGTCLAEDGDITFETDERLNLLSFTVLGLRVIFLKTVSFNLLLTFRLWSR